MIINHQHRFIYIKTWKSAGSSIQAALMETCGPNEIVVNADNPHPAFAKNSGHSTAEEVRQFVGADIWNEYFKFSFVRNPWDTYVSGYWWRTNRRLINAPFEQVKHDFKKWLLKGNGRRNFALITSGGQIALDFIGRFENLSADFQALTERLQLNISLPPRTSPITKSQFRPAGHSYQRYYDDESLAYVATSDAPLIQTFGYKFE